MAELLHIPFSPWSEKARWALELCGVSYDKRSYVPILGELTLRRALKRYRGPVSVPMLRDGASVYADSFAIARYADAHGTRKIFPPGQDERIAHYDALSERGLAAGRALSLKRVLASGDAVLDFVPKALRRSRSVAMAIGRAGIRRTFEKYGGHLQPSKVHQEALCEVLDTLRADLAASPSTSEPRTLLDKLSYADVAMAQVLAFVRPPAAGPRMGQAMRRALEDPLLAERYSDLLAWRDALYARYREARG